MSTRSRKLLMTLHRVMWITITVLLITAVSGLLPFSGLWLLLPFAASCLVARVLDRSAGRAHTPELRPAGIEVDPPVTGRWSALNSPADKTPSHGTHAYGQTYAIDIVAEPDDPEHGRPGFSWLWPVLRRNRAYPSFGRPLLAVADATVVRASDRQRDHLSRTSLLGVLYLMVVEAPLRDMISPRLIMGNHVILDLGDGTYAAYAHVRRGSLRVRAGDRVRAGQQLADCGNSGNSSEPHLHFHLMDGLDPDTASGIPFRWRGVGVPADNEVFTVAEPAVVTAPAAQSAVVPAPAAQSAVVTAPAAQSEPEPRPESRPEPEAAPAGR
ncbi:peptidoglycan DD-metalloendopeptidase family protein [Streptomyces sp. CAU 1734]|uniref:peptidoglycan DD-metalloendopeptidase family protein n=1 Tax=Streptomyces sp. CAU 1734 TaxID=3140360 RepID=UPI003260ED8D